MIVRSFIWVHVSLATLLWYFLPFWYVFIYLIISSNFQVTGTMKYSITSLFLYIFWKYEWVNTWMNKSTFGEEFRMCLSNVWYEEQWGKKGFGGIWWLVWKLWGQKTWVRLWLHRSSSVRSWMGYLPFLSLIFHIFKVGDMGISLSFHCRCVTNHPKA